MAPMPDYDAVFFDAGFTLLSMTPSLGEAYSRAAEAIGHPFPADRFQTVAVRIWHEEHLPRTRRDLRSSEALERQSWWDYNAAIVAALEPEGFTPDFERWFEELYAFFARPDVWTPMPGAIETLDALAARGKRLAVISNWDSRLRHVLDGHDLADRFDVVLTSAEAGVRKPGPDIFRQALERVGVEPDRALHVGDSFEDDVEGARAVGITPVHLRARAGTNPIATDRAHDHHTVSRLDEVLEIVG